MLKQRLVLSLLVASAMAGCASSSQHLDRHEQKVVAVSQPDQKPDLGVIPTVAGHDYRYVIYGDPVAAPQQAFSDASYLYLQLKPDQVPPLVYTRDGSLVEYEVIRSIMKLPKMDSVVLRIGARRAYVDHKNTRIISQQSVMAESTNVDIKVNFEQQDLKIPVDADANEVAARAAAYKKWRICYAPVVSETKFAKSIASALRAQGADVTMQATCEEDGFVDMRGENR